MRLNKYIILFLICLTGFKVHAQNRVIGMSIDPVSETGSNTYSFINWFSVFYISYSKESNIGLHIRLNKNDLIFNHYKISMPNLKVGMTYRIHQYRNTQFFLGAFYAIGMANEEFRVEFPDKLGNIFVIQEQTSQIRNGLGIEFIMIHPIGERFSFVHHLSATNTILNNNKNNKITQKYPGLEDINDGFNILDWTLGLSYRF
jgi:hypothetical protein